MLQWIKDRRGCRGHPSFTHRMQPRLSTNNRQIRPAIRRQPIANEVVMKCEM